MDSASDNRKCRTGFSVRDGVISQFMLLVGSTKIFDIVFVPVVIDCESDDKLEKTEQ